VFIIRPVSRACRYPLLFRHLLKIYPPEHEFYGELVEGVAACNRIVERCSEAQRQAENAATVEMLKQRVEDWKGHNLADFGELLLDDVLVVKRSDVEREYRVFLFEKIIIFCKEVLTRPNRDLKGGKKNFIWERCNALTFPSTPATGSSKAVTPLLLKGRIHLSTVTHTVCNNESRGDCANFPY
jgi:cell division control protein 24